MTSGPPQGPGRGRTRRPAWPSLEEQLAAAGVIHGSALEQLIQDNQDFAMLRPEEATDRLGIPPWLRVYFRKQHPGGDYTGPGGYPHLLSGGLIHDHFGDFDGFIVELGDGCTRHFTGREAEIEALVKKPGRTGS
jgi:hypothetical protein